MSEPTQAALVARHEPAAFRMTEAEYAALTALAAERMPEPSTEWWIATGRAVDHGRKVMGPFASRTLALVVRGYVEQAEKRDDLWVVAGLDIPPHWDKRFEAMLHE